MITTARLIGIDDAIVGTFLGAFTISTAFWASNIIISKWDKKIFLQPYILSVLFAVMTVTSLYWAKLLGTMPSFLFVFGMERLLFGFIIGCIVSILSFKLHEFVRQKNGNKNKFPFQGVLLPIIILLAVNMIFYVIGVV